MSNAETLSSRESAIQRAATLIDRAESFGKEKALRRLGDYCYRTADACFEMQDGDDLGLRWQDLGDAAESAAFRSMEELHYLRLEAEREFGAGESPEVHSAQRTRARRRSNNPRNPNKNVCALAVAEALGVDKSVRYLHTLEDVKRAARAAWSVRSVWSAVMAKRGRRGKASVGNCREAFAAVAAEDLDLRYFLVCTPDHVYLVGRDGSTLVDTDPRKRDRRRVVALYAIRRLTAERRIERAPRPRYKPARRVEVVEVLAATAHTSGPWCMKEHAGEIRIWARLRGVARVKIRDMAKPAEDRKNARLMAAAPELLEALERLYFLATEDASPAELLGAVGAAKAAIRKAKGTGV